MWQVFVPQPKSIGVSGKEPSLVPVIDCPTKFVALDEATCRASFSTAVAGRAASGCTATAGAVTGTDAATPKRFVD